MTAARIRLKIETNFTIPGRSGVDFGVSSYKMRAPLPR